MTRDNLLDRQLANIKKQKKVDKYIKKIPQKRQASVCLLLPQTKSAFLWRALYMYLELTHLHKYLHKQTKQINTHTLNYTDSECATVIFIISRVY